MFEHPSEAAPQTRSGAPQTTATHAAAAADVTSDRALGRPEPRPSRLDGLLRSALAARPAAQAPLLARVVDVDLRHGELHKLRAQEDRWDEEWFKALLRVIAHAQELKSERVSLATLAPGSTRFKNALRRIVVTLRQAREELDKNLLPGIQWDDGAYGAVARFSHRVTALSRQVNDEVAALCGVTRAGAGGRPDANDPAVLGDAALAAGLGLSAGEQADVEQFVSSQGGTWKERREALTAIYAKQANLFSVLTPGKQPGGPDIEYRTTDAGKPAYWDQKTVYSDQTSFDGRLHHTHMKAQDAAGRRVGILLDSTFEGASNYEKAWLSISNELLDGLPGSAVLEVRAPAAIAALLPSRIVVNEGDENLPKGGIESNVLWAEALVDRATAPQNGVPVIRQARLLGAKVKASTERSYARYANNRDWLPDGAYKEVAVKGGVPNEGLARFVVSDDPVPRIYFTVTHYTGFTIRHAAGPSTNHNPFYRVLP
jgi:hypothetical protein